jgi:hypothetical protein
MEKQIDEVITDKNFKSNKDELISNKENQIEEMAILLATSGCVERCANCECYKINLPKNVNCDQMKIATDLYNAGYRKERQGKWKVRGLPRPRGCPIIHAITCSNCGFDIEMLQGKRYKYCPNCGSKMRGE